MKRTIVMLMIAMATGLHVLAQSSATSAPMQVHIQKDVIPANLELVPGSVTFVDANNNQIIDAQENCYIEMKIRNAGRGDGYGCVARINATGSIAGLSYQNQNLSKWSAGETRTIKFPIKASMNTIDGQVQFTVMVDEPNGFGTEPLQLNIQTHKFDAPRIEIVSYKIESAGDGQLHKKQPFKLQVLLQNTDQGEAKEVTLRLHMPENVFLLDGELYQRFASLQPNEQKFIEFEMQSNASVKDELDVRFQLGESYGKYAQDATIHLQFDQVVGTGMMALNIQGKGKEKVEITKGSLISDVDENIPVSRTSNPNTYAVIIANENYSEVADVPYALNDGNIFREYCQKTLGLSEKHIHYVPNATLNKIKAEVTWLQNMVDASDNPKVIFYYAGHGIPDESNRTSYLLPVDGLGNDVSTGYRLDDLFSALGSLNSESVTVFMDACFSGSKRESGMLVSARGVALKAKPGAPQGHMVVFSAAQSDETAYPYRTQQHGLFTYYLLKKIQETAGNITYSELSEYINKNVRLTAVEENNKPQTPTTTASTIVGDSWKNWTLK